MVNRPKNIGTKAERAVVNVLVEYFPEADRRAMQGRFDHGDVINTGIFCFEVKGGEQAKNMKGSREVQESKLTEWFAQTEAERVNSGAIYGVLVTQRGGYSEANAGRWWAWCTANALSLIMGGWVTNTSPVRMELTHFLQLIDAAGLTPGVPDRGL